MGLLRKSNSIEFEFANLFGYSGLNGEHMKPSYALFRIDLIKLLDFLSQNGIVNYIPTDFKSSKTEHFSMHGESIDMQVDNAPTVLINNESIELQIKAALNLKSGPINLSSNYQLSFDIDPKKSLERYQILIPYHNIENPKNDADYAITICSYDFDHFYYTIKTLNHILTSDAQTWIFQKIEQVFNLSQVRNNKDLLDFMYEEIPLWVIARRNKDYVFRDLKTILRGSVNEIGSNEELAVLKIIKSFATYPTVSDNDDDLQIDVRANSNYLLTKALNEKIGNISVFQRMYEVINDFGGADNFSEFIQLFYLFWLASDYKDMDVSGSGQPLILDYESKKTLGFYSDNKLVDFFGNLIIVRKKENTINDLIDNFIENGTIFIDEREKEQPQILHMYQPINIPETNQKGELKFVTNVVPAFYLKAFADKNAFANLEKATWLTVDIVTTFTGVGNLLKLRHLKTAISGMKALKILIAGVEVASGALGLMLNFVEKCDNPKDDSFCNKLRTFLIYVDLATLGVDALASKFIKKSAIDALDSMPPSLRKQHPEIADELMNIAREGKLTNEAMQTIRNFLKKYGYTPQFNKVTIDLYDSTGKFYFRLDKAELEIYFSFVNQSKNSIISKLKTAFKELKVNKKKYNPKSKTGKKFNVPANQPHGLCPNYKNTKYMHSPIAEVKIRLTGSREKDFEECRRIYSEKTGLSIKEIKRLEQTDYVWHHLDDLDDSLSCSMQLVLREAHEPTHLGAVKIFELLTGIKYKT